MAQTKIGWKQVNRPAPVWFRKGKKIFSNLENLAIGILLLMGYTQDSFIILVIKLVTSSILENLETILGNGQYYVPSNEVVEANEQTESKK